MTDQALQAEMRSNKGLLVAGGVLIGIGGLAGSAGMLLLSSALLSATRRWMRQLEQPPSQMAKVRWRQARAAASAGAQAWRDHPLSDSPGGSPASSTLASSGSRR